MRASKSKHFSDHHNEMATFMKALAHPARIAIVEYLRNQPSCICGDLVNALPLSQPTISQYLKN
jgi:ArsR family transcriptional regulator